MKFTKLHSLGNDFVVIYGEAPAGHPPEELARKICDRHTGAGGDGLLLISIKNRDEGRVGFRIFNADGTEAEISGNGLRCAAAFLYHHKETHIPRVLFETTAGERACQLLEASGKRFFFQVEMGTPRFSSDAIPFDDGSFHERIVDYPLNIQQKVFAITCVNVGNPQCNIFVERFFPPRIVWNQVGQQIESHPFFPHRTNVQFIRVINRQEIEVLFWERGVGETLSSGSGSCAAAVASILKGLTDRKVKVWTSMGSLLVEWEKDKIFQSGPAEVVFDGDYLT